MAETVKHATVLDTGQQQLGGVYAKALLAAAQDAGIADQLLAEFDAFMELLAQLPQLEGTLSSPRIPTEVKLSALDKLLQGRTSPTLLNFLKVLCRRRRFDCIHAVHEAAHKTFNELMGRVVVQVTTATPMDDNVRARMVERLQESLGKQVVLRAEIDPQLIGGLVIRVGDTRYDASLANELNLLRETVAERSAQAIRDATEQFETRES